MIHTPASLELQEDNVHVHDANDRAQLILEDGGQPTKVGKASKLRQEHHEKVL